MIKRTGKKPSKPRYIPRISFNMNDQYTAVIKSASTLLLDAQSDIAVTKYVSGVASIQDFLDFATCFSECRPESYKCTFVPGTNFVTSNNNIHPVYMWPWHGQAVPSASEAVALGSSYMKMYRPGHEGIMTAYWKNIRDGEENQFRPTTSGGLSNFGGIVLYTNQPTGSGTEVGRLIEEWVITFKFRRG